MHGFMIIVKNMEYKIGDRVEIINYGSMYWAWEGKEKIQKDLNPELVGMKAVVTACSESQPGFEKYALDVDGHHKVAWFGLKQLKRI